MRGKDHIYERNDLLIPRSEEMQPTPIPDIRYVNSIYLSMLSDPSIFNSLQHTSAIMTSSKPFRRLLVANRYAIALISTLLPKL